MKALDLNQLEELIRRYPWYSLARREYFLRMLEMGPEYAEEALAKVALYLPSRLPLFRALQAQSQQDPALTATLPASLDTSFPLPEATPDKPKIVVVGGDYFSREDFEALSKTPKKEAAEPLTAPKVQPPKTRTELPPLDLTDTGFFDEDFYTETLGKIYAEQGFSQRALEVYEKLILLYPEKSAYFAAPIEEIKKHL